MVTSLSRRFFTVLIDVCSFMVMAGALTAAPAGTAESPSGKTVVVTDVMNRRVTIRQPLDRVVTVNTASAIIIRALGADLKSKIVGVTSYITENPEFWPGLKDRPSLEFKNLNYETLAELNPQLLILYATSPRFTQEEKLTSLGIEWLYLDCFTPATLDKEIRLLGSLFGRSDEAETLVRWYKNYDRLIQSRLQDEGGTKRPRMFYYRSPDLFLAQGIYRTINRHSSSHTVIERAGGLNLAAAVSGQGAQVSAEWIVERNPEVIVAEVQAKRFSGYSADCATAERNMKTVRENLINDKALKVTDAVRNNRVLLLSHDIDSGPSYVIGMACIAKFLYPDRFRDIDPDSIACEYFRTWCGLPCRGVFICPPF